MLLFRIVSDFTDDGLMSYNMGGRPSRRTLKTA